MILVLVALLLQTAALSKEARGSFWELSVGRGKGDQNKQYVYIEDRGADIKVTDLATSTETLAKKTPSGQVDFVIESAGGIQVVLKGSLKDSTLTGSISPATGTAGSSSGPGPVVRATRLASLWSCSGHSPAHLAATEQEMRDAVAKNSCKGWYKVSPPK
jgi:hypothetical protein